jgi:predicted deacylase
MSAGEPREIEARALGGMALPAASRHRFRCPVTGLADGSLLSLPVLAVCGRSAGPRLMVVGGVHGDEADGIAAALALWEALPPDSFAGRVTIVPIANPPAFAAGRRRSPIDDLDLNRVCPGDPAGTPSERLAAVLATLVRSQADFLFTLHGWYASGTAAPHVEFDQAPGPTQAASRRACFAAGYQHVVAADWPPGLLPKVATAAGIPAMESEIGGQGTSRAANVAYLLERIRGLMRHLGMLPAAEPAPAADGPVHRRVAIAAPAGGVLRCRVEAGEPIAAGAVLGEILDPFGRVLATVAAPEAGLVVTRRTFLSVMAGENIFMLFVADPEGRR